MTCSCGTTDKYKLEIIKITQHNDTTYSFDFKGDLKSWHEGDASKLYLQMPDKEEARKFSYATLAEEDVIRFTTRITDTPSAYKSKLLSHKVGDHLIVSNPVGDFRLRREDRPIVLLSNGVGIAATRAFVKAFEKDVTGIPEVLQINVDRSGEIYSEEMKDIEGRVPLKSLYLKGREDFYKHLNPSIEGLASKHNIKPYVYVVGSDAFVLETRSHLKKNGFKDDEILIEKHILSSESCGCPPDNGCGCGSNIIKTIGFKKVS